MTKTEFLIEILKTTPNGAIFESSEYISNDKAIQLGLVEFKEFVPSSVGLIFEKNSDFEQKWVDFIEEEEITQIVTHFRIYKDDSLIAISHDFPDFNSFDPKYYRGLEPFNSSYEVKFSDNLSEINIYRSREIVLHNVKVVNGVFSLGISLEIDDELFSSRIEIEEYDYNSLNVLLKELNEKDILVHYGASATSDIGLTIKKTDIWIDLMVQSTPLLVSNLLWLVRVKSINEIKELGLKDPNQPNSNSQKEKISFLRRLNPFYYLKK
jgi:hypothetical protein